MFYHTLALACLLNFLMMPRFCYAFLFLWSLSLGGCGKPEPASSKTVTPENLHFATVQLPVGENSGQPYLAVQGSVLWMSWMETDAKGQTGLRLSALENETWSPPKTVATGKNWFVNRADFPSFALLDGQKMAAFHYEMNPQSLLESDYQSLFSLSKDGGQTWSLAPQLEAAHGTSRQFISLMPYDASRFFAVWLDNRNHIKALQTKHSNKTAAQAQRSDLGVPVQTVHQGESHEDGEADTMLWGGFLNMEGGLEGATALDARTCDCCTLAATRTKSGVLVAYRDRSKEEIRDISFVRLENGTWTAPQPISKDAWKIKGCPVNGPALASKEEMVAAAWFTESPKPKVQLAFSKNDGKQFSPPLLISDQRPSGSVSVVWLKDRSALVSWLESGDGGGNLYLRRVWQDGKMGTAQKVTNIGAKRGGLPKLAVLGNTLYIAWTQIEQGRASYVKMLKTNLP